MICVYPAACTDFSNNGLGAVSPQSCTVTETLNGEWELTLVHPIDDLGKWQRLTEGCILRAPVPAAMTPQIGLVSQQYQTTTYVTDSHPAIISIEEFDAVQQEITRRKELGWRYSGKGIFAGKLLCGDCGGLYGAKVWHSTDAYRCVIWQCNHKYHKKECHGSRCLTPHFKEQEIITMFMEACEVLLGKKQSIAQRAETIIRMLTDCTELDAAIQNEESEMEIVSKLMQEHIRSMATQAIPEEEAKAKQATLESRFHTAEEKCMQMRSEKERRLAKSREIRRFAKGLTSDEVTGWREKEWLMLLDKATVQQDRTIDFLFKDGTNIKVRAK